MVVEFFEVVVGGFRSFHVLVTTTFWLLRKLGPSLDRNKFCLIVLQLHVRDVLYYSYLLLFDLVVVDYVYGFC